MTRREKLEARLEYRELHAGKAAQAAVDAFGASRKVVEGIPLGQPILVGHHSEKAHRGALRRADSKMRKGLERQDMAARHAGAAAGLERMLKTNIFSDDADAIEALEAKIEKLEGERKNMRDANRLYRKGDAEGLAALGFPDLEALKAEIAKRYTWEQKGPYVPYQLSNLGGRIAAAKKRLAAVKVQQERAAAAEAAGGVVIEGADYVAVTFAEKPARELINELKAAGFRWGGGSWLGYRAKLPEGVK